MRYRTTFLLLLSAILSLPVIAQVGVNNTDPEQALDVAGKIKVADDAVAPSDGTIRYNDSESAFEGFTEGEWQSFNKSAVPEDVQYVQLYEFDAPASGDWVVVDLEASPVSGFGSTFDGVPDGKKLMVDFIQFIPRADGEDLYFRVGVSPTVLPVIPNGNSLRNPRLYLSGNSSTGNAILQATRAPLFVVHAGGSLAIYNSTQSETAMRCVITGFLVDADATDDFFTY